MVEVSATLVADREAAEAEQPADGALHDPAPPIPPQLPAVLEAVVTGAPMWHDEIDAALSEALPQVVAIVAAVRDQPLGLLLRAPRPAGPPPGTALAPRVGLPRGGLPKGARREEDPPCRPIPLSFVPLPLRVRPMPAPLFFRWGEGRVQGGLAPVELPAPVQVAQERAPDREPHVLPPPRGEPAPTRPRAVVSRRHLAPPGAGSHHPEDALEAAPVVRPGPPALRISPRPWQRRRGPRPLRVRHQRRHHPYAAGTLVYAPE